ncbi:MAG: DUF2892 domain-containing protein [Moraxella sp.]|uniref:YgaP family membrane protein n=1 Tax=Moraxella sp. TaxID=479 RepID=UPI0026DD65FB|nr:DUF2892 domain-containing protein [Moraxella sp.]MDO4451142.1 DUF2892 domain-containing protein [Moraxella sp.]
MKANLHSIDRTIRIILGIVLIGLAITGVIGWWGYLGVIALATGAMKFCPLYRLLGISTCKKC